MATSISKIIGANLPTGPQLNASPYSLLVDCDFATRQMIMNYYQEDYSYEP
jgi:hypothetical protein